MARILYLGGRADCARTAHVQMTKWQMISLPEILVVVSHGDTNGLRPYGTSSRAVESLHQFDGTSISITGLLESALTLVMHTYIYIFYVFKNLWLGTGTTEYQVLWSTTYVMRAFLFLYMQLLVHIYYQVLLPGTIARPTTGREYNVQCTTVVPGTVQGSIHKYWNAQIARREQKRESALMGKT